MIINNLPKKYERIWKKCLPYYEKGRAGDAVHARETVEYILGYRGKIEFDPGVVIPTAMMHDIGHAAILPEHFRFVTGPEKIKNGKLVHMLAGAKIAKDILGSVGYDKYKTGEIVDIISIHDFDQLKGINVEDAYNTVNKRFFHDIDGLDRYTETRIKNVSKIYPDRNKLLELLEKHLSGFFYDEFKQLATNRLRKLML